MCSGVCSSTEGNMRAGSGWTLGVRGAGGAAYIQWADSNSAGECGCGAAGVWPQGTESNEGTETDRRWLMWLGRMGAFT